MTSTKRPAAKTALVQAMNDWLHKKPFNKISVNDLCAAAQVSRSAFYANFEDKYQLFSYCTQEKKSFLDELMQKHSPEDCLYVILDFIQSENRFFYNALGASHDEEIIEIFYSFFNQYFTALFNEKDRKDSCPSGPVEVLSAFYIGGLTNTIVRWIKSNYKLPKSELAACQYALIKDIL